MSEAYLARFPSTERPFILTTLVHVLQRMAGRAQQLQRTAMEAVAVVLALALALG